MAAPGLTHALFEGSEVWWPKRTPALALPAGKPRSHLLAGFDEYVLGYTDRQAIIDPAHAGKLMTPNGLFRPALLLGGRVAGTWQAEAKRRAQHQHRALRAAAARQRWRAAAGRRTLRGLHRPARSAEVLDMGSAITRVYPVELYGSRQVSTLLRYRSPGCI